MNKSISDAYSEANREAGKDFRVFRQMYFKHYHKWPDAPFHKVLAENLNEIKHKRGSKMGIAGPRGSGKTSVSATEYVVHNICYGIEPYIVLFSNTAGQAIGLLEDIKRELLENRELIRDFPEVCEIDRKPGPPRWCENEIITRNRVKVTALGYGQQPRGRKNKNERPTLIICDDLEPSDDFESLKSADKMNRWLVRSVLKMGTAITNVIVGGTLHNYNSLLAKLLDQNLNPEWIKIKQKAVVSWAERIDLWSEWAKIYHFQGTFEDKAGPDAAEKYYHANEKAMLEGAVAYWPEQMSYYQLMVLREREGHLSFDSEMQNDHLNPEECSLSANKVVFIEDRQSIDELLRMLGPNKFISGACDPATGKDAQHGDCSAIVTVVRDTRSGVFYVLNADIKHRKPGETMDAILQYSKIYNYDKFIFEENNFQVVMADELQRRALQNGCNLKVEKVTNTKNKYSRIMQLQPLIESEMILFSKKDHALLEELRTFPKGHDDGLDALMMAISGARDDGLYYGPLIVEIL